MKTTNLAGELVWRSYATCSFVLMSAAARYQASMLRSLKEVQADDSIVGSYQAMTLGSFYNQSLVDTQAIQQEKLRQGGIVLVHGALLVILCSISLFTDRLFIQISRGQPEVTLHSVLSDSRRLSSTPTGETTSAQTGQILLDSCRPQTDAHRDGSLISHRLKFSSILEEIPIKIRTSPLLGAFLETLSAPSSQVVSDPQSASAQASVALPPSYSVLNLGTSSVSKNLEQVIEALDAYKTEEGNIAYNQRQIAREKAKADAYVAKRKEENAARVAQGLAPLPEEDVSRLFKIPAEPSRMESMLLLGRIDAYSKTLEETSSAGLVKMYAARGTANV
jgi:translation initiation factor 3 subunit H